MSAGMTRNQKKKNVAQSKFFKTSLANKPVHYLLQVRIFRLRRSNQSHESDPNSKTNSEQETPNWTNEHTQIAVT